MTSQPQPRTRNTDRYLRAPKGGAISPVNGLYYLGGQFMPLVPTDKAYILARPAPLAGSVRQIAWAERIRREALTRIEDEIHGRRLFLAGPVKAQADAARQAIKPFLIAQHRLATERSAAAIIERRAELV